jgi:hypothetical protein
MDTDIELIYPNIDPKHIQSEDAVRQFHSVFYDMVEEKYGEYLARRLLQMPPHPKAWMNKRGNARLLFKFLQSGLDPSEFAKRENPDDPEGLARNMRNWRDDEEIKHWLTVFRENLDRE